MFGGSQAQPPAGARQDPEPASALPGSGGLQLGPNAAESDPFFNRPRSAQQQYDEFAKARAGNQKSDRKVGGAKASLPSQAKSSFQKEGGVMSGSYHGSGAGNFGFPA